MASRDWHPAAEARIAALPRPERLAPAGGTPSPREGEVLDALEVLFTDGFDRFTMADLAREVGCSLRLLYRLAPSREGLCLLVVDRALWRAGQQGRGTLSAAPTPLDALRAYLRAVTRVMDSWSPAFVTDLDAVPATRALREQHDRYVVGVTVTLLDLAVAAGQVAAGTDTRAVGRVLAELGRTLSRPDVVGDLATGPRAATDAVVDVILAGLTAPGRR